jgi:transcriptional regulator with XRE-family HTH domain
MMDEAIRSGGPEEDMTGTWAPDMIDVRPVFRGLADGGVAGKDIAKMLGVAPSTVSKWRRGAAKPNEDAIQFLTLILADIIGAKERALDAMEDVPLAWRLGRESELAAMRQSLYRQEAINRVLKPTALRDGARMFRDWLDRAGAPVRAVRPQTLRVVA